MRIGRCFLGCDFPVFFPKAKDATGDAIDLTGASLSCAAMVSGSPVAASATSVDAIAGTAEAVFSAAQTSGWAAGTLISFDGVVTLANGRRYAIGEGQFRVYDPITP